jgi:hypothetical protein
MPIQTSLASVAPGHWTVQDRFWSRVSVVNEPVLQPLTTIPPAAHCHESETQAVVYHRLQVSRRDGGESQLAVTLWACAELASPQPQTLATATTTARRRRPTLTATAPS